MAVTAGTGAYAMESMDGQTLYFTANNSLWSTAVEGGSPTLVVEQGPTSGTLQWAVVQHGIHFIVETDTSRGLKFYDFRSGKVQQLLSLTANLHGGLSVSPDRKEVLFTPEMQSESDILLVDEFR